MKLEAVVYQRLTGFEITPRYACVVILFALDISLHHSVHLRATARADWSHKRKDHHTTDLFVLRVVLSEALVVLIVLAIRAKESRKKMTSNTYVSIKAPTGWGCSPKCSHHELHDSCLGKRFSSALTSLTLNSESTRWW